MIRTLRAYFLGRALREKLMIVAILGVAVVMWATAYSSRLSRFLRAERATTAELKLQDSWIARRGEIEAATHQAASEMVPSNTLDLTELTVAIRQYAGEASINVTTQPVATTASTAGQFSIHQVRVDVINANWNAFTTFYRKLQARAPYIAITEFSAVPTTGNPGQVRATMMVVSFEIKH